MTDDDVSSVSSAEDNHGFNINLDGDDEEEELFRTPTSTTGAANKRGKKSPSPPKKQAKKEVKKKQPGKGTKRAGGGGGEKAKGKGKRQKVEEEEVEEDDEEDEEMEMEEEEKAPAPEEEDDADEDDEDEDDDQGAQTTEMVVFNPEVAEIGEMQMEDDKLVDDDLTLNQEISDAGHPVNSVNNIKIAYGVKFKKTDLKGKYDIASYLATGEVKAKTVKKRKELQDNLDLKIATMDDEMIKRLKDAYAVAEKHRKEFAKDYDTRVEEWRVKHPALAARIDARKQARSDRIRARNKAKREEAAKEAAASGGVKVAAKKAAPAKASSHPTKEAISSSSSSGGSAFDSKEKKNAILKAIVALRKETAEEILQLHKRCDDRIDALLQVAIDA